MTKTFRFALFVATMLLAVGCNGDLWNDGIGDDFENDFTVLEFTPAPGQFVNKSYSATTAEEARRYAQDNLDQGYWISLGGFGGYVVVKFDRPIPNTGGYDFGIYGNSFVGSSEPGVVWVSCDENGNGLADDEWYELYGSESAKATTLHNYEITYSRTDDEYVVAWRDSEGASGIIERNTIHTQDYFPAWISGGEYRLSGTLLPDNGEWNESGQKWVLKPFEWGYVDNYGAADCALDYANRFRICDAHNALGERVNLEKIDFVKVQSATNVVHTIIGEVSTEVSGFVAYSTEE